MVVPLHDWIVLCASKGSLCTYCMADTEAEGASFKIWSLPNERCRNDKSSKAMVKTKVGQYRQAADSARVWKERMTQKRSRTKG